MSANILFNTTYPHGTADGFRNGCRGSHCPAPVACKIVHGRYVGDFAFRRAIDSGLTPIQVIEAEHEQEQIEAAKEKPAKWRRSPEARKRLNAARRKKRAENPQVVGKRSPDGVPRTELQKQIHALHAEKLTDAEIAKQIGRKPRSVKGVRSYLWLAANSAPVKAGAVS